MKKLFIAMMALFMLLTTAYRNTSSVLAEELTVEFSYDDKTKTLTVSSANGVKTIGNYTLATAPYNGNTDIETLIVDCTITSIGNYAFYGCTNLRDVYISSTTTSIGEGAFGNCTSIQKITIPSSVDAIGKEAFKGCTKLASVTFSGTSVPTIGTDAFKDVKEDCEFIALESTYETLKNRLYADAKITTYEFEFKSEGPQRFMNLVTETSEVSEKYAKACDLLPKQESKLTELFVSFNRHMSRSLTENSYVYNWALSYFNGIIKDTNKFDSLTKFAEKLLKVLDDTTDGESSYRLYGIGSTANRVLTLIPDIKEAEEAKAIEIFDLVLADTNEMISNFNKNHYSYSYFTALSYVGIGFVKAYGHNTGKYDDLKTIYNDLAKEIKDHTDANLVGFQGNVAGAMFAAIGTKIDAKQTYIDEYKKITDNLKNCKESNYSSRISVATQIACTYFNLVEKDATDYDNLTSIVNDVLKKFEGVDQYDATDMVSTINLALTKAAENDKYWEQIKECIMDYVTRCVDKKFYRVYYSAGLYNNAINHIIDNTDAWKNIKPCLTKYADYLGAISDYRKSYVIDSSSSVFTTLTKAGMPYDDVYTAVDKFLTKAKNASGTDYEYYYYLSYVMSGLAESIATNPIAKQEELDTFNSLLDYTNSRGNYIAVTIPAYSLQKLLAQKPQLKPLTDEVYNTLKGLIETNYVDDEKQSVYAQIVHGCFNDLLASDEKYNDEFKQFTIDLLNYNNTVSVDSNSSNNRSYMYYVISYAYTALVKVPTEFANVKTDLYTLLDAIAACPSKYSYATSSQYYNKQNAMTTIARSLFIAYMTKPENIEKYRKALTTSLKDIKDNKFYSANNIANVAAQWITSIATNSDRATEYEEAYTYIIKKALKQTSGSGYETGICNVGVTWLDLLSKPVSKNVGNDFYKDIHIRYQDSFKLIRDDQAVQIGTIASKIMELGIEHKDYIHNHYFKVFGKAVGEAHNFGSVSSANYGSYYSNNMISTTEAVVVNAIRSLQQYTDNTKNDEFYWQLSETIEREIKINSLLIVSYEYSSCDWIGTYGDVCDDIGAPSGSGIFLGWYSSSSLFGFDSPIHQDFYLYAQYDNDPNPPGGGDPTEKVDPTYETPTGLEAFEGDYLGDVELPEGFTWQDETTTPVGEPGTNTFLVTYTPEDTDTYNIVEDIEVSILVKTDTREEATYETPTGLTAYEGGTLADVVLPEGFKFQDGGNTPVGKVGTHTFLVTYTPEDTDTYAPVHDIEVEVVVTKKEIARKDIGKNELVDEDAVNKYGEHQVIVQSTKDFDKNITLIVKVVVAKSSAKVNTFDYSKITDPSLKLKSNEKIGIVFDVKLYRTVNGVTTAIQPTDLDGVTSIKVLMLIPESVDTTKVTRILHVHHDETIEEIAFDPTKMDENRYYEVTITKLSEFAFVYEKDANPIVDPNPNNLIATGVETNNKAIELAILASVVTCGATIVFKKKKEEEND